MDLVRLNTVTVEVPDALHLVRVTWGLVDQSGVLFNQI